MKPVERIRAWGITLLARAGDEGATPLILLHGIGSNAQTWSATMTALDPAIPVIAWNAPGYDESEPLDGPAPTPTHYAERLAKLLDALAIDRVLLAGHSLGCLFAGRFAALYPGRVAGLALFSPALGNKVAEGEKLPPGPQARIDDLQQLGPAAFAKARAHRLVFHADTKPDILRAVQDAMAAVNPPGYAQAVHALATGDLLADAARITVPSVVGTGSEDLVTPPANAHAVHAALRCPTPVLSVPNAGHALPQEDPVAVANLLGNSRRWSAMTEDAYLSPPVLRAARLLRHIAEGDSVTNMARTGRALGINRTTLLRLLHSLEAERLIERTGPDQGWKIGLGLIGMAAQAFFSEDLFQLSVPVATRLADSTGLSAHLGVLDGTDVIYMIRRTPNLAFASNMRVGTRLPAHASVMGRIILAYLPWDTVERLFAGASLPASTEHTPVTLDQLRRRLDQDRATGLAWSTGHYEAGISSVAAPLFDTTGAPVAALNVSGQNAAFEGRANRERIEAAIRGAAEEISRRLGWGGAMPGGLEAVA